MPYLYIAISALLSILIAHVLKLTENRKMRTLHVLTLNYVYALIILPFLLPEGVPLIPPIDAFFLFSSIFNGITFITNFFVYSKSVNVNGVGISVVSMRMSLVIPVVFSIVHYQEPFHAGVVLGLLMVLTGLTLMILKPNVPLMQSIHDAKMLLAMFLMSGSADILIKIYERIGNPALHDAHFVGGIYVVALASGLIYLAIKRELNFTKDELLTGAWIGVPNLLTFVFMLKAIAVLPATVAFSMSHISVVLGGTLLGRFYWKDHLFRTQWLGILIALASILVLILL